MDAPSADVVEEFGVESGTPTWIPGGQGTTWRAGDVVLKPLDMSSEQLEWQAQTLAALKSDGFRVAVPLQSRTGKLIVQGWTAWPWLAGHPLKRWTEILSVGVRFHDALGTVPRPSFLDRRQSHWAHADRVAWGEAAATHETEPIEHIGWLLESRRDVSSQSQVIHGDLSGNVLFTDGQPPAIIDFSPYWRPKSYASAIVVIDAIAWNGASVELLQPILEEPDGAQLLIRALLFRLLSDSDPTASRYPVMVETVLQQLSG